MHPKLFINGLPKCISNAPVQLIVHPNNNYGMAWITDYAWWRHQMETFSALLVICAGNSPVPGEFPTKRQWRGALMFSFICAWINGWANNRKAGDLRRNRAHYDVSEMVPWKLEIPRTIFGPLSDKLCPHSYFPKLNVCALIFGINTSRFVFQMAYW